MGIRALSEGDGVRIAILDSGTPLPLFNNQGAWSFHDDEFGHATAIASILFGGVGIHGLCEKAEPRYIKVLDRQGRGTIKSVVKGIYSAIESDVDLINLSLGFYRTEECPEEIVEACDAAFKAGKTIICAAGNDGGRVNWPAALKTTICVGATDQGGHKISFSSSGEVDFVVPGVNLPVFDIDGHIKTVSGTSFATAIVTGMAAAMLPKLKGMYGSKIGTPLLVNALRKLTVDIDAPGWDIETGYGLLLGDNVDPVNLKIKQNFFGTIISSIKSMFGHKARS